MTTGPKKTGFRSFADRPLPKRSKEQQHVPTSPWKKDKYRPVEKPAGPFVSPSRALAGVWIVVLALSFLGLDRIQVALAELPYFRGYGRLQTALRVVRQESGHGQIRLWRETLSNSLHRVYSLDPLLERKRYQPRDSAGGDVIVQSDGLRPNTVLLVGASSMQFYLGAELERAFETYEDVRVVRFGKLGTGLARPDVFDWPAKLSELIRAHDPELIIAQFGGNDAQAMRRLSDNRALTFASGGWNIEYGRRIEQAIDTMRVLGAEIVFLGTPIMRDEGLAERVGHVNRITRKHVLQHGARYFSLWELTSDEEGNYVSSLTIDKRTHLLRLTDGIHLSRPGARYVTDEIATYLEKEYTFVPLADSLAARHKFELPSAHRGFITPYQAYVPRDIPQGGLPVLLLLHGAYGSYTDWSDHAHKQLSRLAARHGLLIVLPDGDPHGWYLDSPYVEENQIASYIMDELLPDVLERLPASGVFGVTGLSMGGHGALVFALHHPTVFHAAGSMSAVTDLSEATDREALVELLGSYNENPGLWHHWSAWHLVGDRGRYKPKPSILLTCGEDDSRFEMNLSFHRRLDGLGFPHQWRTSPGGHDWQYWTSVLPEHIVWQSRQLHGDELIAGDKRWGMKSHPVFEK
ncbi:DUF459 domain-containing protein [bacterium]|nr:DUF459 domain-containing protein [bacterium]